MFVILMSLPIGKQSILLDKFSAIGLTSLNYSFLLNLMPYENTFLTLFYFFLVFLLQF